MHYHVFASGLVLTFLIIESCAYNPFKNDTDTDYSTSAYDVRKLVRHEQKLIQLLIEYKEATERKLKLLSWYLSDFEDSVIGPSDPLSVDNERIYNLDALAESIVKNPITTYRLISRFVDIFTEIDRAVTDLPENDFISRISSLREELPFPKENNLNASQMSLIRLHHTYKISLDDFETGIIQGAPESDICGLEAMDFYQIGFQARRFQLFSSAIEFWNKALEMGGHDLNFDEILISKIESTLSEAIIEHDKRLASGKFHETINRFHFLQQLHHTSHENFKNRVEAELDIFGADNSRTMTEAFQRLCRGESIKPPNEALVAMKCYLLKNHPFFLIQPLKVEFYSTNPPVLQIYDVLSESEMLKIRNEAVADLAPSRIHGSTTTLTSTKTSLLRTSSNTWISDHEPGNPFEFVSKRIELITGLKVFTKRNTSSELMQIANYGPGGFYTVHYDATHEKELELDAFELERGDRISTFMFYLSEVQSGGATAFPKLGIAVQPVKGSALWWYNLHSDLSINRKLLHGGCPVLYGNKWVANKWIRAYDQMFTRPCPSVQSNDLFM